MQLHEIENLSGGEIKARRAELVAAACEGQPQDVAARYLQARLDAKLRDVRLAEMGQEITDLQANLQVSLDQREALAADYADLATKHTRGLEDLAARNARLEDLEQRLGELEENLRAVSLQKQTQTDTIGELQQSLQDFDRAKVLAKVRLEKCVRLEEEVESLQRQLTRQNKTTDQE